MLSRTILLVFASLYFVSSTAQVIHFDFDSSGNRVKRSAESLPDLTPSQIFSDLQLPVGATVDMVVAVRNVGSASTNGEIQFYVTNYSAATGITVAVNSNPTVTIAGSTVTLNTNDFTVSSNSFAFDFKSKPGITIAAGSRKYLALRLTRTGGSPGSVTSTVTIADGTGGESLASTANNSISNTLVKSSGARIGAEYSGTGMESRSSNLDIPQPYSIQATSGEDRTISIRVNYPVNDPSISTIRVYASSGRLLHSIGTSFRAGTNILRFPGQQLTSGIYLISCESPLGIKSTRAFVL